MSLRPHSVVELVLIRLCGSASSPAEMGAARVRSSRLRDSIRASADNTNSAHCPTGRVAAATLHLCVRNPGAALPLTGKRYRQRAQMASIISRWPGKLNEKFQQLFYIIIKRLVLFSIIFYLVNNLYQQYK
ncbi:Hypothetical_protein [Hexamita inflata]|uniref:Hypothetical_protein n=1 Tax=Hexamita inflata TaxID=28002 RepID=A0AA86TIX8_9EUKA|nr:Hypothetical protein HINF_LOCUS6286 [Hexamita inflata]